MDLLQLHLLDRAKAVADLPQDRLLPSKLTSSVTLLPGPLPKFLAQQLRDHLSVNDRATL